MLTEWGRRVLKPIFEFVASVFQKLHITPNTVTVVALVLSVVVAYLIIIDQLFWAGVLYFIGAGLDAIDGTLARQMGVRSNFGAFLDSTLDRSGRVNRNRRYWCLGCFTRGYAGCPFGLCCVGNEFHG